MTPGDAMEKSTKRLVSVINPYKFGTKESELFEEGFYAGLEQAQVHIVEARKAAIEEFAKKLYSELSMRAAMNFSTLDCVHKTIDSLLGGER